MSSISLPTGKLRRLAMLFLSLIVLVGFAQTPVGRVGLRNIGFIATPPAYTSLAFSDPQGIPEALTAQTANVPITFRIENVGSSKHSYQWSIRLVGRQGAQNVYSGATQVGSRKGVTISSIVKIHCTMGRVAVLVELAHPAESIDSWITCASRQMNSK